MIGRKSILSAEARASLEPLPQQETSRNPINRYTARPARRHSGNLSTAKSFIMVSAPHILTEAYGRNGIAQSGVQRLLSGGRSSGFNGSILDGKLPEDQNPATHN